MAMRSLVAVSLLTLLALGAAVAADEVVKVFVNDCPKIFNPPAIVRDGTTYVPLRAGAEAIGATVRWDAANRRAIVTSGARTVTIPESRGIMVNNRLLLPLRMMGEALGCRVSWDARSRAVMINTPTPTPAGGG